MEETLTEKEMINVLKKGIKKAEANGYKLPFDKFFLYKNELLFGHTWWAAVIFSHEFAKYLWMGEDWKKHLQLMVLEENPLVYLKKFV